jgi:hypothetical protein
MPHTGLPHWGCYGARKVQRFKGRADLGAGLAPGCRRSACVGQPLGCSLPFGDRYMISENQDRPRFDRHIVVNCEDDMHKAVMERAAREMISASAWIRQAVRDRLRADGLLGLDKPAA